jgi:hypothetical protein
MRLLTKDWKSGFCSSCAHISSVAYHMLELDLDLVCQPKSKPQDFVSADRWRCRPKLSFGASFLCIVSFASYFYVLWSLCVIVARFRSFVSSQPLRLASEPNRALYLVMHERKDYTLYKETTYSKTNCRKEIEPTIFYLGLNIYT